MATGQSEERSDERRKRLERKRNGVTPDWLEETDAPGEKNDYKGTGLQKI